MNLTDDDAVRGQFEQREAFVAAVKAERRQRCDPLHSRWWPGARRAVTNIALKLPALACNACTSGFDQDSLLTSMGSIPILAPAA